VITIVAAVIQANHSITIAFIWRFDNNRVFQLIQMVGVKSFISDLRAGIFT
jgi:hypothetical protein